MTDKNRTPYLRLTPVDVEFLVDLFDGVDECPHADWFFTLCKDERFSKLWIQMDDFLIRTERKGTE